MLSPSSPFPHFLIPSIPFRRRRSSAATTSTIASDGSGSSPSSPSNNPTYLSGSTSHLQCTRCLADLCLASQIISKGFTGRHGRAYLVAPAPSSSATARTADLPNTHTHKAVPRQLVTGAHTVSDISCALCGAVLGWKYVAAEEESQKYKVGKYILETKRVSRGVCWENEEENEGEGALHGAERALCAGGNAGSRADDDHIEFDSQDEDECEDLFAGVWSPALARKRRKGRAWRENRGATEEI
ncbi:uncharacterized protein K452DRAFT_282461 [Aplosporella prunicola CBS 121167]|uniref:Yippee domain-containing protein n=1 Tax=Aplosporella prunicola CBS 121167 TaxID=1176127 RepID=A0A6A6BUG7_9PEZI|nr:uncharacterized protein K452DRAFT_282461 [Aplosporella prunicola CBS 121167]KAF2147458.1 hypothetical protein K452DRAFT_282461 [Aplosporella prunicola CBS 121167]